MRRLGNQKGTTIMVSIIISITFLVVALAISSLALANYRSAKKSYVSLSALTVAESGIDQAIYQLNQDNTYTGTSPTCPLAASNSNPTSLFNDASNGKAIYETCITNGTTANEKILYSRGRIYLPTTAVTPFSERTVRVILTGSNTGGNYSVQTGPGGLILSNSASITNGAVYVGGKIAMSNTATIGSVANPVNTWAAYYNCPVPATSAYPIPCNTGEPISISNTAHIYGDVRANNQTTTSKMSNGGLVASSGVANVTLPNYDRNAQKSAATNSMSAASASCSNNQTRTWPANLHITGGNVSLSNNCVVTMMGNVWIDGNLTTSNRAIIKIDDSVSSQPTIMIDGAGGYTMSNQSTLATNASQIGPQIITFWSAAACSPNCNDVTGSDLYNSQSVQTINIANQGLGAGANFYSRWSKVVVGNSGTVNKIIGQTVQLSNTGGISFGLNQSGGNSPYIYDVRYYERL